MKEYKISIETVEVIGIQIKDYETFNVKLESKKK